MDELKPCPFCGCKEITRYEWKDSYGLQESIYCDYCTASIEAKSGKATGKWNRRTARLPESQLPPNVLGHTGE